MSIKNMMKKYSDELLTLFLAGVILLLLVSVSHARAVVVKGPDGEITVTLPDQASPNAQPGRKDGERPLTVRDVQGANHSGMSYLGRGFPYIFIFAVDTNGREWEWHLAGQMHVQFPTTYTDGESLRSPGDLLILFSDGVNYAGVTLTLQYDSDKSLTIQFPSQLGGSYFWVSSDGSVR